MCTIGRCVIPYIFFFASGNLPVGGQLFCTHFVPRMRASLRCPYES